MKFFISAFVLALLSSCTRAQNDKTTQISFSIAETRGGLAPSGLNSSLNPGSLAEINCYIVLVTGPEDSLRRNVCKIAADSSLFQVGQVNGGFFATSGTTSITLDVPNGNGREIKLVGFKVGAPPNASISKQQVCEGFKANDDDQSFVSEPFILAQASGLELTGGIKAISMTASLNSALKVGDCQGPDFPKSLVPAKTKIAVELQDAMGSSAFPLKAGSCVSLRIQLRDQNGTAVSTTASTSLTLKTKNTASVAVGSFFSQPNPNARDACQAAGALSADSAGLIPVILPAGSSGLSLSFEPNSPSNTHFEVVDPAGVLQDAAFDFNYSTVVPVSMTYAILEGATNTSTVTASTASKKIFVPRSVCRHAYVQILDADLVPMNRTIPIGTMKPALVSSDAAAGEFVFYSDLASCTANTTAADSYQFSFSTGEVVSALSFYYKVLSPTLTDFSFAVTNTGAGGTVSPNSLSTSFFGVLP